jgi:general secretion pathway protein J
MRTARGFTLFEMLISIALVGLLTAFAYRGYDEVARAVAARDVIDARLAAVQRSLTLIASDLEQAQLRPVREGYHGSPEPALRGGGAPAVLEFTRAGWRNPGGAVHGPLQRVSYALEDDKLVRSAWRVLDRAPDSVPTRRVLMTGVSALDVRFLSADDWVTDWPAVGEEGAVATLPRAVRIAFTVEGEGRIERVVEMLGNAP